MSKMLHQVDWTTLVFFMSLFMMVGGIQEVGLIQLIAKAVKGTAGGSLLRATLLIIWVSAIASAVVANIPFTAAIVPVAVFLTRTIPGAENNAGRLTCQLSDGRTLEIFRVSGKSGGPLTVTTTEGSNVSEAAFAAAIGHVSSDLYQNVFSLGLQELYEVDIVNLDEVKDRIYGAGLGGVSIPGLKSHFEKHMSKP